MKASLFAALLSLPVAAHAQIISGAATAIDGDSLSMTGASIRLYGIDAPEADQSCQRDGAAWQCGKDAAAQLAALVQGKILTCKQRDMDVYRRIVAVCHADQLDLGQTMIEAGLALALPQFSDAYVEAEAHAKKFRVGLWASEFVAPSTYRAANPPGDAPPSRADRPTRAIRTSVTHPNVSGCVIKGNRNREGQWIYHLPGMPYYDVTRPEDIFCSEAEAQAAGYRRAIVRP